MSPVSRLRKMLTSDLDRVRDWRNADGVRRYMYSTDEIGVEEHLSWFEEKLREPGRHLMILEVEGEPVGFVNFGPGDADGSALWGFYVAPRAPAGTGRQLGEAALDYAFNVLGLRLVCGEVLACNSASIAFHGKLGFRQEGGSVKRILPGARSVAVVRFLLSSDEFSKRPASP